MPTISSWLLHQWMHRGLLAHVLWPLHLLMKVIVTARRAAYLRGWMASQRLSVPVIVVGNRLAGGAGKTPTVMAMVEHLQRLGWTPGVLSRGYGRENTSTLVLNARTCAHLDAASVGDEPWLIWQKTHVPIGVARDRHTAGLALVAEHPQIDVLITDDGLQHLALCRDIEVVLFDERGAGNGFMLPAGLLREPINSPPGPGCQLPPLVLYTAGRPSTRLSGFVGHRSLQPLVTLGAWWAGRRSREGQHTSPPETITPHDCWAVAGIAQPLRFFEQLSSLGYVAGQHFHPCALPDHDNFDPLPWPSHILHVMMTEKDAAKLDPKRLARERPGCTVWVAPLQFEPEPAFWAALDERLARLGNDAPTMPPTASPLTPSQAGPTPWTRD